MKYDSIYKPHPAQLVIHKDKHRFRTLVCGRRFGKTTLSVNELIVRALKEKAQFPFWYGAPTYKQAKQIAWQMLKKFAKPPLRNPKKDNETELSIQLYNGNKIALKGLDNAISLEGVGLSYFVGDEISAARNWDECWQSSLRPMLMDTGAGALFISKPRGYNHFHTLAKRGDHNNIIEGEPLTPVKLDPDYITYRFTTYDNPHIPREEIEKTKEESTEGYFDQEVLAKFTRFTGLVYKEFDRNIHVIDPFDIPESWQIFAGVDFGTRHPTVFLWVAVDNDGNWFIIDEYFESTKTIDYHAGVIKSNIYFDRVLYAYADPSGAQWIDEFRDRGVYMTKAVKETGTQQNHWVRLGIEKIAEALKVMPGHFVPHIQKMYPTKYGEAGVYRMPRLYVFSKCVNTIREFENYKWKQKRTTIQSQDATEPDMPEKVFDDCLDSLRYFAVSQGVSQADNLITKEQSQPMTQSAQARSNENIIPNDGGMEDLF